MQSCKSRASSLLVFGEVRALLRSLVAASPTPHAFSIPTLNLKPIHMPTPLTGRFQRSQNIPIATTVPMAFAATVAGSSLSRQVRVSHILLPADDDTTIKELRTRLQSGEDFASLAKGFSKCPSRGKGGDIGWVSPGQTVQEFETAAFKATKGVVTTCKTQFGNHLLVVTDERAAAEVKRLSVQEAAELLAIAAADPSEPLQLIDVREEWEVSTASLPGFRSFPMSRFAEWAPGVKELLDPSIKTVCLCHHGIRSQNAAQYLVNEAGFTDVSNIVGGIDAYSRGVDNSVPLY